MRRFLLPAALVVALLPFSASAQGFSTNCPTGQSPHYSGGFAVLSQRLGQDIVGAPLTCEFPDPNGTGDVMQLTTKGLSFWRKRTNTPTFTNGATHWALLATSPTGVAWWTGTTIDPPPDASWGRGQGDVEITRWACEIGQLPDTAPICEAVKTR